MVIVAVFMLALLGMAALVIDYGNVALQRRALQNSVDAAALAGASSLAGGWSSAQPAAQNVYPMNGYQSDQVTYQQTTDLQPGDSVTVRPPGRSTRSSPRCSASAPRRSRPRATATIQSFTQVPAESA